MVWTNLYMEEAMLIIFLELQFQAGQGIPLGQAGSVGSTAAGVPGSKAVEDDNSLQEVKRK